MDRNPGTAPQRIKPPTWLRLHLHVAAALLSLSGGGVAISDGVVVSSRCVVVRRCVRLGSLCPLPVDVCVVGQSPFPYYGFSGTTRLPSGAACRASLFALLPLPPNQHHCALPIYAFSTDTGTARAPTQQCKTCHHQCFCWQLLTLTLTLARTQGKRPPWLRVLPACWPCYSLAWPGAMPLCQRPRRGRAPGLPVCR